MVTEAVELTASVLTVKVAEFVPSAIVTLAGTVAAETLLLARVTVAPPAGASPLKVTVAVDVAPAPPMTAVGFKVSAETEFGLTVRIEDRLLAL